VARYTPLASRGSISQQELDNTVQNNLANLAALEAAKANVANAKAGVAKAQAEIAPRSGRARRGSTQYRLDEGHLPESPVSRESRTWTSATSSPAPRSSPPSSLLNPIYVQVAISEQEYLRWKSRSGDAQPKVGNLEINPLDGAVYAHRGTAEILDREVGTTTGTIRVRGVFPNPGDVLRPGQYAKVRTVIDTKAGALLVPQRAVKDVQGQHEVAVVGTNDTVDLRKVKVAERVGSLWIVAEGLKLGERVIVEGIDKVRAGEKVKPMPADAPK